jgi:AraC-like DNA-binding protein
VLTPARITQYLEQPDGHYVTGRCWLTFCCASSVTGLTGYVAWGSPTIEDLDAALKLMPTSGSPLAARRPRYVDLRALEAIDHDAVARFASHVSAIADQASRVAIVYRGPLGASLATGFPMALALPYMVDRFADPVVALAWAGHPAAVELARELDELAARTVGTTPLVRELRGYLAGHLREADVAATAQALGQSVRSLQRKLRDEATTFQRELDRARVDAAKAMLARSEATLDDVAARVGTSRRSLEVLFRRYAGVTPRRWRRD